jgi:hypothetical protein
VGMFTHPAGYPTRATSCTHIRLLTLWRGGLGIGHRFNHTVLFHPTALHSPAVGLNSANSAIWNLLNGGNGSISVNNHPMDDPTTKASKGTDVQVRFALLHRCIPSQERLVPEPSVLIRGSALRRRWW